MKRVRMTWLVCFLALGACSQGENETCQVGEDCEDGLSCCGFNGVRGTCNKPSSLACMEPAATKSTPDAGMSSAHDAASQADGG